jgi:hypothetical protein
MHEARNIDRDYQRDLVLASMMFSRSQGQSSVPCSISSNHWMFCPRPSPVAHEWSCFGIHTDQYLLDDKSFSFSPFIQANSEAGTGLARSSPCVWPSCTMDRNTVASSSFPLRAADIQVQTQPEPDVFQTVRSPPNTADRNRQFMSSSVNRFITLKWINEKTRELTAWEICAPYRYTGKCKCFTGIPSSRISPLATVSTGNAPIETVCVIPEYRFVAPIENEGSGIAIPV